VVGLAERLWRRYQDKRANRSAEPVDLPEEAPDLEKLGQ